MTNRLPHQGMPPLDKSGPPISFYEFWPTRVFYAPMSLWVSWLALRYGGYTLPTIANPLFPAGGVIGESKSQILSRVDPLAREYIAPFTSLDRRNATSPEADLARAREAMAKAGLSFPVVTKPDLGCRGVGVRTARSDADLLAYIAGFPAGERFLIQTLIDEEGEAGVFYVREPGQERGQIISLTLKYFPYVTGDGASTLEELIARDPRAGKIAHIYRPRHAARLKWVVPAGQHFRLAFAGSHSRGTIFRDGRAFVTDAMTDAFDRIAKAVPEFYFGRFDVRFRDIADLQRGENFKIVEINGAAAEATHVWDRKTPILSAYRDLMGQYETLYRIGAANRRRGFKPMALAELIGLYFKEKNLVGSYPLTE